MIRWRYGVVTAIREGWPGVSALDVDVDGDTVSALAYLDLVGQPSPGDGVLLNTTALAQGLGTGGFAMVVGVPDRLPADPSGPGHVVKARYTPLQVTVQAVDEQGSPHHAVLQDATSIDGMPVVVADLHSALPAVLCGLPRDARVVYVMSDGGALPVSFSRTVAGLRAAGWLAGCVTVGQSYGGDLDAVTVHSGLLAARHVLNADVCVVTQGPGNLGTGTRWGFSGVASGEAINAVGVLGGRPVACLRVSAADPRPRHQGVSHHSVTAYGSVALVPADVVVPLLPGDFGALVRSQVDVLGERHRLISVPVDGLETALRESPVPLSTMGRGLDDDPPAFLAAAAAGRHAASLT